MYTVTVSAGPNRSTGYYIHCGEDRAGATEPYWLVRTGSIEQAEAVAAEHSRRCTSCNVKGADIRQADLEVHLDAPTMEALLEVAGISPRRRRMKATEFYARLMSLKFSAKDGLSDGEIAANGQVRPAATNKLGFGFKTFELGSLLNFALAYDRDIVWAPR